MKPWHAGCLPALSGQLWLQGERMLFLFICLFSDNFLRHHIFLCEPSVGSWWCWQSSWNGMSSSPQRKALMFQVLKFQNIFLLLRLFLGFFFMLLCRGLPFTYLSSGGSLFKLRKHFRKTVTFGFYETHNSIFCSAWVLVWHVLHVLCPQGSEYFYYITYVNSYLILL